MRYLENELVSVYRNVACGKVFVVERHIAAVLDTPSHGQLLDEGMRASGCVFFILSIAYIGLGYFKILDSLGSCVGMGKNRCTCASGLTWMLS